jgi:hypothetical protein
MKILPILLILAGLALALPVMADPANPADAAKAIVVELNIKGGNLTYLGSHVVFGYPPDNLANRDFGVELIGNGVTLMSLGIEDPRILYEEDGAVLEDDVDFAVIVPFVEGVQAVRVTDRVTNATPITVDVQPAITSFYAQHPEAKAGYATAEVTQTPLSPVVTVGAFVSSLAILATGRRRKDRS